MQIRGKVYATILQIFLFLISFGFAWLFLAFFDFGYSLWFDILDIKQFIEKIGPANKYKEGFGSLSKIEYTRLFHEISVAIHVDPESLEKIEYTQPKPNGEYTSISLLRAPEVLHLQDVAHLIRIGKYIFVTTLLSIIGLFALGQAKLFRSFSTLKHVSYLWLCLGVSSLVVYSTNPVKLFYWLHEIIFPDKNQWFFFYQDSLMTTLMRAPDIFGPISVSLLATSFHFHVIFAYTLQNLPPPSRFPEFFKH